MVAFCSAHHHHRFTPAICVGERQAKSHPSTILSIHFSTGSVRFITTINSSHDTTTVDEFPAASYSGIFLTDFWYGVDTTRNMCRDTCDRGTSSLQQMHMGLLTPIVCFCGWRYTTPQAYLYKHVTVHMFWRLRMQVCNHRHQDH